MNRLMTNPDGLTRHVKIRDLPLVRQLSVEGVYLDSELELTRHGWEVYGALLASLFLPQRSVYTLLTRTAAQPVLGQFRLRVEDHIAQIMFMTPGLETQRRDTAYLHLLDAMTAEAGRRGAHVLTAEVEESNRLFQTMRNVGFAVYSRQAIWQHEPGRPLYVDAVADLTPATPADTLDLHLLYCHVVPRLVQQIAMPSNRSTGLVYRQDGALRAYIAVTVGRDGIYLLPYLHPDVLFTEAKAILAGALAQTPRAEHVSVYVCVRRFEDWLEETLIDMGFEPWQQQALLARHITAGVRHASFAPLSAKLETLPHPVRPPTNPIGEPGIELVDMIERQ